MFDDVYAFIKKKKYLKYIQKILSLVLFLRILIRFVKRIDQCCSSDRNVFRAVRINMK